MRKTQCTYNNDYNLRLRNIPSFTTGAFVFIDSPTLRTLIDASGEAMTQHTYNKLQADASGPYRIVSVQKHTLTIDDNGNQQTESSNRVANAPSSFSYQLHKLHNSAYQSASASRDRKDAQAETQSVSAPRDKKNTKDTVREYECTV